jgi:hypothetical protein
LVGLSVTTGPVESPWKAGESKWMPNTINNISSMKNRKEPLGIRRRNYLFGTKYLIEKNCLTLGKAKIILQAKSLCNSRGIEVFLSSTLDSRE